MYDDTHLAWDRAWGSSGTGSRIGGFSTMQVPRSPGPGQGGGPIDPESSFCDPPKKKKFGVKKPQKKKKKDLSKHQ